MNARRLTAATLVALSAVGLTACNRDAAAPAGEGGEETLTIGLAVANLQADFFNQIQQSVEAEAGTMGIEVVVADAGGDSATQVNQIQDFITRQVDAIIYIPAGATAAGVPVTAAQNADIPVVAVDRNAPDAPADTFIATDSVAAAQQLGEWVIETSGGRGELAILQGQIGTTPQVDRQEGFEAALAEAPGITKVAEQTANWSQDEGFAVAQDMLQVSPTINIFWGQADAMALGAAQAVANANVPQDTIIVGFDGDFAGMEAVRDGVIDATMVQQTQEMGRMAVRSAVDLTEGDDVPAEQLVEAFLLTTADGATADEYIAEHP